MTPVRFSHTSTLKHPPEVIADRILDLSRWPDFEGYGPLPGIAKAEFERRTDEVVGTRIRVSNRDGSTHIEELMEWDPPRRLRLRLHEFSPPVSRLSTGFDETWEFQPTEGGTKVTRSFAMYPRTASARPTLWVASFLMKRAVGRHMRRLRREP